MLGQGKAAPPKILSPEEAAAEDMKARHGDRLLLAEMRGSRMIAVLDADAASIDAERRRLAGVAANTVPVEVIDATAWDMLRRLSDAGVLTFTGGAPRILHEAASPASDALLAAE